MKVLRSLRSIVTALLVLAASPAAAQYTALQNRSSSQGAIGEDYNVELAVGLWKPTPAIIFSSEQFGIPGSTIDLQEDLDVPNKTFRDFRLVLRPARKHKLRVEYIPIVFDVDTTLRRSLVFNGNLYSVGLPVTGEFKWDAWRFGYEYDFIHRDRGYLGLLLEAKYTHVRAELTSSLASEFAEAKAPIPAVGVTGRGYLTRNVAVGGEVSLFRLPSGEDRDYTGKYYDYDFYGTINFSNNFGVTGGYRKLHLSYQVDSDFGEFRMNGMYVMGVARF